MATYNVKGSHVVLARAWFEQNLGKGSLDRLANVDGKPAYPAVLLPGTWYDALPLARAFDAAAKDVRREVDEVVAEVARQNALQDLTTIYRVFLRVASPVRFLAFTPTLWRNYVQFADAKVVKNERGHYVGTCSAIPRDLYGWCAGGWRGFLPTAIELAGAKKATIAIAGPAPDPDQKDLLTLTCTIRYE
jgi:hypothetical protein